MADNLLNSSISALATKIATDVASASIDELVDLARAAQSIGEDDNTTIETAINTRVNALYSSATPEEIKKLAVVVDKMTKLATVGSAITDISQLTDNTSLLSSGGPDLSAVGQHILPTTDDTYDLGSSSKKFRDVYLGASTLYLGDKQISSDAAGIVLPAGSKIGTESIPSGAFADITGKPTTLAGYGITDAASGGATVYANMAALISATGMSDGDQAYVTSNKKLYLYNGGGWYLVSTTTNDPPSAVSGVSATYTLAKDGTATVITAISTDPEGFPLTWSHAVTTGSLGSTATISQTSNVFTITPSTTEADAGEFSITFSATDGVNTISAVSSFTLSFSENSYFIDPRDHGMITGSFSGCGINSNDENLYVLGYNGDQNVYKWQLSTPNELASIPSTFTQRTGISSNTPAGFYMNHAGTYYYYCSYSNVYQVSLSTANDLTTGTQTYTNSTTGGQAFNNGGLIFGATWSHTGHRLYIANTSNQNIREHHLTTNWDISTAQNATNSFNPTSVDWCYGMGWNSDGTKLWSADYRYIREYSASSAYSLSGMSTTPSTSYDLLNLNGNVTNGPSDLSGGEEFRGLAVSADGNRLYINLRNKGVYKLTMTTQNTIADGFVF